MNVPKERKYDEAVSTGYLLVYMQGFISNSKKREIDEEDATDSGQLEHREGRRFCFTTTECIPIISRVQLCCRGTVYVRTSWQIEDAPSSALR